MTSALTRGWPACGKNLNDCLGSWGFDVNSLCERIQQLVPGKTFQHFWRQGTRKGSDAPWTGSQANSFVFFLGNSNYLFYPPQGLQLAIPQYHSERPNLQELTSSTQKLGRLRQGSRSSCIDSRIRIERSARVARAEFYGLSAVGWS